ncbi:MAG: hypothetical protein Q9208_002110 [Pyrenodesmia sp. 3 TL-2023]
MSNQFYNTYNTGGGGPPNDGIPPQSSSFLPPRPPAATPTNPAEPPGGRFHNQIVSHDSVRALFSLDTAVFNVVNKAFLNNPSSKHAYMYAWEFPVGLTVSDLGRALGTLGGIREVYEKGGGEWAAGQVIRPGDEKAGWKLKDVGWSKGRGVVSKPVWLLVLKPGE